MIFQPLAAERSDDDANLSFMKSNNCKLDNGDTDVIINSLPCCLISVFCSPK